MNLLSLGGSVLRSRFSIGSSVEVLSGGEDAARIRVDLLPRRGTAHDDVIHAVDARDFTADLEAGVMSPERWSVNPRPAAFKTRLSAEKRSSTFARAVLLGNDG